MIGANRIQRVYNYLLGDCSVKKTKQLFASLSLLIFGVETVQAEYALNLMKGATQVSNDIYDLHMLILWICVAVGVAVFGVMFYSIYHHRKSRGHKAAKFHENTMVEIIWTVIPTLILVGMAIPATKTMLELDNTNEADMSIKVTGWQWKWEYEYLDEDINFFSTLDEASNEARQVGSGIDPRTVPHYLLNVDRPLVIPVRTKIRFLFTAADVLHSWWVPDLGWKKDTVPGFINESWTYVEKPGTYRGQCAELCGKDHGFMPIVVIAMEQPDYENWVAEEKQRIIDEADAAGREWSQQDLIANGEKVYTNNCASCHMQNGAGIEGTFPALRSSTLVNSDQDAEIQLVLNGKGMMPAFGYMLSAVDFASVVTYTRNALGNSVGDTVQPSKVQPMIEAMADDDDDDDDDDD